MVRSVLLARRRQVDLLDESGDTGQHDFREQRKNGDNRWDGAEVKMHLLSALRQVVSDRCKVQRHGTRGHCGGSGGGGGDGGHGVKSDEEMQWLRWVVSGLKVTVGLL
jgi:hypothetical protein